ncbi:MAG: DMT family transporter [Thermoplasmata archaeon]|nr:DMT family transporter [Thermoplasmata archaeon]
MNGQDTAGHLAALITIVIWGTTYISTKLLLEDFEPVEILFIRFVIGFTVLLVVSPHIIRGATRQQELTFVAAGLSGICLYYLLENIALTYTLASNVGMIASITPFFTAIAMRYLLPGEETLRANFFIGFVVALVGIFILSYNGTQLELNPKGDILALLAGVAWAIYSVLTKRISTFGYGTVQVTRRVFLYGILFMIPCLFILPNGWNTADLAEPSNLLNILYLGLGASALCFVTWNYAVKRLGAVRTSVYIYIIPVVTVVTSVIVLGEPVTALSLVGILLCFVGLALSEDRFVDRILHRDAR